MNDMNFDDFFDKSSLQKVKKVKEKTTESDVSLKEERVEVKEHDTKDEEDINLLDYLQDVGKGNNHRTSISLTEIQMQIIMAVAAITGESRNASSLIRDVVLKHIREKFKEDKKLHDNVVTVLKNKGKI